MDIFENLENLNVSEECFDEIMGIVEALLSEDLAEKTKEKYGADSPQYYKADDLWDKAWTQAQKYFAAKGANHDLSTRRDIGQDKHVENEVKRGKVPSYKRAAQNKKDFEELGYGMDPDIRAAEGSLNRYADKMEKQNKRK